MSHWVPIKYISEKYQIDENYICNLIVRKVVTSSQIGRKVKLIDEDSFVSYLDLHKEIEDKKEIIAQLRDTDRMLDVELRACNETHVAFEVQQRILFRVYRAFVQAFSLLCFQRDRFASFAGIERQRINGLLKRQLGEAVFTCGADGQSKIVACKVLREIVCVAGQDRLLRRSADADVRLLVKAQIADLECSSFIQPEVILRVLRAVAGDAGRAAQLERTGAVHAAAQDLLFGGLHFARQAVARDDAAVQHGGGVLRNDNTCAIAACVVDDVHVCQIKLVIIAHADRACCCAGDPATGKRALFACRDIGLLPGIAAVVKDKRAVFVDVIIAGAVRSVAVSDGKDGRIRVLIAHGDEDDAALSAVRQTERVAVQAERDLRAVFGHAERLFKSQIIRNILFSFCQFF